MTISSGLVLKTEESLSNRFWSVSKFKETSTGEEGKVVKYLTMQEDDPFKFLGLSTSRDSPKFGVKFQAKKRPLFFESKSRQSSPVLLKK